MLRDFQSMVIDRVPGIPCDGPSPGASPQIARDFAAQNR